MSVGVYVLNAVDHTLHDSVSVVRTTFKVYGKYTLPCSKFTTLF